MRIVLLADGNVGTKLTRFLMDNYPSDIALIVTTKINEIYSEAENRDFPVCVFESENQVLNNLAQDVDLGILAWWPKILKSPLLDTPRLGFVNTHPSLLPYNRGKHYNFWALVEQAPYGVTLHCVDSGIDTGNLITQSTIEYDWCDTGKSLYDKAQTEMVRLFRKTYPMLRTGNFETKPQDDHTSSFHRASEIESASKINLDANYKGRDLINLIRARTFKGFPGAWFEENGIRYEMSIKIKRKK